MANLWRHLKKGELPIGLSPFKSKIENPQSLIQSALSSVSNRVLDFMNAN